MAAPSSTVWGEIVGDYCRIGIYRSESVTDTTISGIIEVWFWSKYSVLDNNNILYYDNLDKSGSATTSVGKVSIGTTDNSTSWASVNQVKLKSEAYSYARGTSDATRYIYAALGNIDKVNNITLYASTSFSIPKLATYTLDINGYLDGKIAGSISGYGTFDMYLNGALSAKGVSDWNDTVPYGTTYEIKNIQAISGYSYDGVHEGSLSGTVKSNTGVVLSFNTSWSHAGGASINSIIDNGNNTLTVTCTMGADGINNPVSDVHIYGYVNKTTGTPSYPNNFDFGLGASLSHTISGRQVVYVLAAPSTDDSYMVRISPWSISKLGDNPCGTPVNSGTCHYYSKKNFINVNSEQKRGFIWINANGTWKKGVATWINENGVWKRNK